MTKFIRVRVILSQKRLTVAHIVLNQSVVDLEIVIPVVLHQSVVQLDIVLLPSIVVVRLGHDAAGRIRVNLLNSRCLKTNCTISKKQSRVFNSQSNLPIIKAGKKPDNYQHFLLFKTVN